MDWNDGLKLNPKEAGGIYMLLCPAETGVEVRLGSYAADGWHSGGEPVPHVIYFTELSGIPHDAADKGRRIWEMMQAEKKKRIEEDTLKKAEEGAIKKVQENQKALEAEEAAAAEAAVEEATE